MSRKKLVLGVLLGAALVWSYRVGAPSAAAAAEAASEPADLRATLVAIPVRVGHGIGLITSKVVAPGVRSMVMKTEAELHAVREDLRAAKLYPVQAERVRKGIAEVVAMDSTALAALEQGRPIYAFKHAMQGAGLAAAVHDNVRGAGD